MMEHGGKTPEYAASAVNLRLPDAPKLAGDAHRPRKIWEAARRS